MKKSKKEGKIEGYRRIRGLILRCLMKAHPGTLDILGPYFLLDDLNETISPEEYESHIAYLGEKGLIVKIEKKAFEIEMLKITAKGLDVVDGIIEEPGVDVRF